MKKIVEPRVKVQISLDPGLIYQVKIIATHKKIQLRQAVAEALIDWVNKSNTPGYLPLNF